MLCKFKTRPYLEVGRGAVAPPDIREIYGCYILLFLNFVYANMEQVSVCARFLHNYEVYEEFLEFVAVAKMDAQTIADELCSTLKQCRMSSVECS